jgi:hypothetical protein
MTRGMTLLETLLAIAMTTIVGAGISGMMHVLSSDVAMQHEVRTGIVRAALVQSRLSAYVGRARCFVDLEPQRAVLWLQDTNGDDTIGASELRWITFDPSSNITSVQWIDSQTPSALPTYDTPTSVDWWSEQDNLEGRSDTRLGHLDLACDLNDMRFRETLDTTPLLRRKDAMQRRRIELELDMKLGNASRQHRIGESIRLHRVPSGETAP